MGDGKLDVDPDQIRHSGGGIRTSAQQLRAELQAFQSELAGFGQPWGNDDLGFLIGGCYQAIEAEAMECFADNIAELEGTAEKVHVMAANYYQAESANEIEVNNIREALG